MPSQRLRQLRGDGRIPLTVAESGTGQGVRTALPLILAEERGVDLAKVEPVQAAPGPDFKSPDTGGRTSVTTPCSSLRHSGAAAREMRVGAAVAKRGVGIEAHRAAVPNPVFAAAGTRVRRCPSITGT